MKIKVSDATTIQLDWAVAKCIGHRVAANYGSYIRIYLPDPKQSGYTLAFCPSTKWEQGGPIIERESIAICKLEDGDWRGQLHAESLGPYCRQYGSTPLIAAVRCYVTSRLGDEVEIPKELI